MNWHRQQCFQFSINILPNIWSLNFIWFLVIVQCWLIQKCYDIWRIFFSKGIHYTNCLLYISRVIVTYAYKLDKCGLTLQQTIYCFLGVIYRMVALLVISVGKEAQEAWAIELLQLKGEEGACLLYNFFKHIMLPNINKGLSKGLFIIHYRIILCLDSKCSCCTVTALELIFFWNSFFHCHHCSLSCVKAVSLKQYHYTNRVIILQELLIEAAISGQLELKWNYALSVEIDSPLCSACSFTLI